MRGFCAPRRDARPERWLALAVVFGGLVYGVVAVAWFEMVAGAMAARGRATARIVSYWPDSRRVECGDGRIFFVDDNEAPSSEVCTR